MREILTADQIFHARLKDHLRYDPDLGLWFWVKTFSSRRKDGDPAGTITYVGPKRVPRRTVYFEGKRYIATRLAWFYMKGKWPSYTIDHKDRDTMNDKWDNLRDATYSEQNYNRDHWSWRGSCAS